MPLSESHWREHLAVKGIYDVTGIKNYVRELVAEMQSYCLIRLKNIKYNLN